MATRKTRRHRRSFGSVRRLPSGRFQARYLGPDKVERTAPVTFETRTAADAWLAGVQSQLALGTWRAPEVGVTPLGEYADGWLASRVDLSPRTRELYAGLLTHFVHRRLGDDRRGVHLADVALRHLTPTLIREWHAAATSTARSQIAGRAATRPVDDAAAARAWARSHGLAVKPTGALPRAVVDGWQAAGRPQPATTVRLAENAGRTRVAQAYRLLRTICGTAVREGLLETNPCQLEHAGTVRHTERRPATLPELATLAAATPERYRAAVPLAAWSGLRGGELFALARRHVDLDARSVRVERALLELDGQPITFGRTKTRAAERTVHLPGVVVDELRAHLAAHVPDDPDALVFATATGRPLGRAARSRMFARARRAAGRPDLRWHDLRHTGAVLAAATGASLAELMHRMGHTSARAAMVYQHASSDRDRLLADRLQQLAAGNVLPLHGRQPRTA